MTTEEGKDMDHPHADMTDQQAGDAIAKLLGGVLEAASSAENGGWEVEIKHIPRYTLDMLPGYDEGSLDYLLLAVENDDEHGYHREVVRMTREPRTACTGVALEGVYRRHLGERTDADATFYGTVSLASIEDWEEAVEMNRHRYSERIAGEAVDLLEQAESIMVAALNHASPRRTTDMVQKIAKKVAVLNRMIVDMGVGHAI